MKLIKTSDIRVVIKLSDYFGKQPISELLSKCRSNFFLKSLQQFTKQSVLL